MQILEYFALLIISNQTKARQSELSQHDDPNQKGRRAQAGNRTRMKTKKNQRPLYPETYDDIDIAMERHGFAARTAKSFPLLKKAWQIKPRSAEEQRRIDEWHVHHPEGFIVRRND